MTDMRHFPPSASRRRAQLSSRGQSGDAGWGRTLGAAIVSLIYFFPVLWIILTAFKSYSDALAVPPKFIFTPTLENFVAGVQPRLFRRRAAQDTGFTLFFFNSLFIAGTSVSPRARHRHARRLTASRAIR